MTLSQFTDMFVMLANQLRATDADEATIRAYYEALKDVEPEFLAWAAQRLAKKAEWFPKTSEWRDEACRIEGERTEQQRALLRHRPAVCLACNDTGWELSGEPDANNARAVRRCSCQRLRRLEVLGRRPWPELPEATETSGRR